MQVEVVLKRYELLAEKAKENNELAEDPFKEYNELPVYKRKNHKLCEKILRKRNSFRLEITKEEKEGNETIHGIRTTSLGEPIIPVCALFSNDLLKELFEVFFDFKKQFTLNNTHILTDVRKRASEYNRWIMEYNKALKKGQK